MESYGNIEAFIEVLNTYGVENVFFNPGIDNVPMLETIAKYRSSGRPAPRSILCLDEFVAMTAAHGNYMATGKPQVVSVHSELGTLQIGGSLHNAQWGKVPVVLYTESLGPPQRTNWRGEPFEQGTMVRNFVKWDHQLGADEDIRDAFHEAFRISVTEPYGPVYLTLQREDLWSRKNNLPARKIPGPVVTPLPATNENALRLAADILLNAENPLIITGHSGRNIETPPLLVKLAELLAARVQSSDVRMNFPNTHPMSVRTPPDMGRSNPILTAADVLMVIDYDMPYAAPPITPNPAAKIIHIDIDFAKKGVPLWERRPEISVNADSNIAISKLIDILTEKISPEKKQQLKERFRKIEIEHNKINEDWRVLAMKQSENKPITANWLSHCIDEVIDENTVIVNQTISPSMIVAHQVRRTRPGTLLSCAGGCIGWAPGAALGAKLALPDKTVISLMGDGAFIYGCPEASLWSAGFYKAPYLAVIFNNSGYGAIKGLFRENYDVENMGADIPTPPDYAKIAQACNAYGRTVEDPTEVIPALKEALGQVRKGQPAVLNVKLESVQ
jgi:acetolactate synthase-1/2/3 large subunit